MTCGRSAPVGYTCRSPGGHVHGCIQFLFHVVRTSIRSTKNFGIEQYDLLGLQEIAPTEFLQALRHSSADECRSRFGFVRSGFLIEAESLVSLD